MTRKEFSRCISEGLHLHSSSNVDCFFVRRFRNCDRYYVSNVDVCGDDFLIATIEVNTANNAYYVNWFDSYGFHQSCFFGADYVVCWSLVDYLVKLINIH